MAGLLRRCYGKACQIGRRLRPRRDRFRRLLERAAADRPEFRFLQVGANDGISFDGLYHFVCSRPSRGVVIEPTTVAFEQLVANYAHRPGITPLRLALHPDRLEARMYLVDPAREHEFPCWARGIASLDPEHHRRAGIDSAAIVTETVPCRPLMAVIHDHDLADLDLLQIDAEGFDGEILRMLDFDLCRPRLIKYEHASLSRPEAADLAVCLRARGYRLFRQDSDTIAADRQRPSGR